MFKERRKEYEYNETLLYHIYDIISMHYILHNYVQHIQKVRVSKHFKIKVLCYQTLWNNTQLKKTMLFKKKLKYVHV